MNGCIIFLNGLQELLLVNGKLINKLLQGFTFITGCFFKIIFLPQQRPDLGVVNLIGDMTRLFQDFPPVLCVRIIPEIRPFVYKSFSIFIQHDAEGVGMFLEDVTGFFKVTDFRCMIIRAD